MWECLKGEKYIIHTDVAFNIQLLHWHMKYPLHIEYLTQALKKYSPLFFEVFCFRLALVFEQKWVIAGNDEHGYLGIKWETGGKDKILWESRRVVELNRRLLGIWYLENAWRVMC